MADEKSNRGPQDHSPVSLSEAYEVATDRQARDLAITAGGCRPQGRHRSECGRGRAAEVNAGQKLVVERVDLSCVGILA